MSFMAVISKSLTSIILSDSIQNIGLAAFADCVKLDSLIIPSIKTYCKIKFGGTIFNVPFRLFIGKEEIKDLVITEEVTSVPAYAFIACKSIENLYISGNVAKIEDAAFYNCPNLKKISITSKLNTIGEAAFQNCIKLTQVELPSTIKTINKNAFGNCSEITDFYCYATICPETIEGSLYTTKVFYNCGIEYATLHVPASSLELYKTTKPWNEFGSIVALTEEETGIETTSISNNDVQSYYSLDGKRLDAPQKGINIVKLANGQTKKVVIK